MNRPADHPTIPAPKIGVLIVNLGTPDAAEAGAVRRYLKEFLSDRRVVEIPPILWQPILRGVILRTRPKKSAHAYAQVWREDGSPLAAITAAQADALRGRFGNDVMVEHAMRYGRPAIGDKLTAMKAAGCERITLISSSGTTSTPSRQWRIGSTVSWAIDRPDSWSRSCVSATEPESELSIGRTPKSTAPMLSRFADMPRTER